MSGIGGGQAERFAKAAKEMTKPASLSGEVLAAVQVRGENDE
jgi:hypothetical protein